MKDLLHALKFLLFDLAATLFFLSLYSLTHNLMLAVIAGLALALGQIGWELVRGKPVDALQWVSLVVVAASGLGALDTGNPLYVMLQPSVLYLLTGAAMLKRGWMNRYLPPRAREYVPDLGLAFGYVWAGSDVFFRRREPDAGAQPGSEVLGRGDLGLGHRQQGRPAPHPVWRDEIHRPPPLSCANGNGLTPASRNLPER